ncbi:MAG: hypothetical protein KatS3mg081_0598 [Gemmatimonadales bacterium]|nr:MAG: hypothetical protein KatS3mg081_0598 [Gemmatimonadales bacterium]
MTEDSSIFISILKGSEPSTARPVLATGEPAVVAAALRAVIEAVTGPERARLLRLVDAWEASEGGKREPDRVIRLQAGGEPEGVGDD